MNPLKNPPIHGRHAPIARVILRRMATRPRAPSAVMTAVLASSGTVVALQQTLLVPLIPELPRILHSTSDNTSWLVTSTLLTGAVGTPIVSRLADMSGKRRMILVCLALMVAGSVLGAVTNALILVIIARSLQGFAAALIPVGISVLRDELPPERVAGAVALMSATLGIGGGIGLPLSGVLYEQLGWHSIFWLSALAGAALIVAMVLFVPESDVKQQGRFDYPGALLLSSGLVALLLAITKGRAWGWTGPAVISLVLAAVVLLPWWTAYELRAGEPMVDIRTAARRPVLLTNIASLLVGFALYCNNLASTQQLQLPEATGVGFGLSISSAGLAMLPAGLAMLLLAPLSARLITRFGARQTLIIGPTVLAIGYVGRVFLTASVWQVVVGTILVSIGTAISYAAMPTLIMRAVPLAETGAANGLNSLVRSLGGSVASAAVAAILVTMVSPVAGVPQPTLQAFRTIFWLAAAMSAAAAVVTQRMRSKRSALAAMAAGEDVGIAREYLKPSQPEIVLRGTVLGHDAAPIRQAVVTVVQSDGQPVDWGRTADDGGYSVVLPGAGRYVLITSADGWVPTSAVVHLSADPPLHQTQLTTPLTLSGTVTDAHGPLVDAPVWVTRPNGEVVVSTCTDASGRYCTPLPPTGRYLITALDRSGDRTGTRQTIVVTESTTADLELARSAD